MSNIIYPENERLSELVTGVHRVLQGTPKGVFTTVDDRYLVVDVNQYDKLATNGILDLTTELSYEDAKMLYGARVIKEYLEKQEQARQQAIERKRQTTLALASKTYSERGEKRRVEVLAKVLMGYSAQAIMKDLECSKATVYNAINSFTGDYVLKIFRTSLNRKTLIEERDVFKFIDLGCNYKEYCKYVADKKEQAVERITFDKQTEKLQEVSVEPTKLEAITFDDTVTMSEADMSARIDALIGNIPEKAANGVEIEADDYEVFEADGEWGE